jgi:hypothetical protein
MPEQRLPLVSFVVPTLNRGRHVVRAVESCLAADRSAAAVDVEVVVLDSESDDGSWEVLQRRFGSDRRVRLVQNRRGLGPTRSWIDGARLAGGQYATFIWSDDYIAPHFLTTLMPPLRQGASVSIASGLTRGLDDDTPLPRRAGGATIAREAFIAGYSRPRLTDGIERPLSPASSLFTRAAFDKWIGVAEAWCQSSWLRRELHWRRAIGPDLLLYLVAIGETPGDIPVSSDFVAQFSAHPGSFAVSATPWAYETGYWLARIWIVTGAPPIARISQATMASFTGSAMGFGLLLALSAPFRAKSYRLRGTFGVAHEVILLWRSAWRRGVAGRALYYMLRELAGSAGRILARR